MSTPDEGAAEGVVEGADAFGDMVVITVEAMPVEQRCSLLQKAASSKHRPIQAQGRRPLLLEDRLLRPRDRVALPIPWTPRSPVAC